MLKVRHVLMIVFALLALATAGGAQAQDEEKDAMRRPERLTVGTDDQFLGQLAPNGRDLYFVSNRHTVNEIYVENIDDGRAKPLFDEGAEVTWPRVSPDGKSILYISYSQRATGQLCVRDLPSGERRRCLGGSPAVLLAEWIDSKRIVAIARATIEGNLRAVEVSVEPHLTPKRILGSNLANPAVSPDGRWLVYVPLERASTRVGPAFRAHAGQRIEAVRIDAPGTPVPVQIDVPGLTGQPVFSKDGRSLYFVQFFADSNHDGVVDADDHGILFRVPLSFGPDGRGALTAGPAVQITDEAWNCQYPAPAKDRLIMTCSRGRNLDLYSLPLDGEVPDNWPSERLALEIDLASSHAKLQILYHHRLARAKTLDARRFVMLRLVRLHLTLEEFDAAAFYAKRIDALDDTESDALSQSLLVLIDHRRALRERERGRMFRDFDEQSRERMAKLPTVGGDSRAAAAMARIVRSEIADTIGDKTMARTELEATAITPKTPRAVLEAYYERADELYRELDDREALVTACRKLAAREKLALDDQLRYSRAAVRAMIRGLPFAEADARLARERAAAPDDSELAFSLDLARIVLKIRPEHNAPVRKELLDFYEKQTKVERHRAIVLDAVQRAIELGADPIVEALAQEYIDDIKPGTIERRRAERLYMQVIIGRAFRRRAAGKLEEARADFEAVATRTGALEAVVGAIDLRLRAKDTPAAIKATYAARPGDEDSETLANFVSAYLLSRQLPKLEGEEHARAGEQAIAALMRSWIDLKNQCIAQSLYGSVLHERYLRTGEAGAAERAGTHYLVALELVGNNLRYKAMVLGQLGLLHTQVGNYRIALGYLKDRDKLPYADNSEGFAVRSAKAQSLLHVGREKEAATAAEEALAMLDRQPKLQQYRVLALDRAALYNLAADQFERALALYDAELPLVDKDNGPSAEHNRFVVRLARAAAALGAKQPKRALDDLGHVDRALDDKKFTETLAWPHADNDQVVRSYRVIAAGLRGRASHGLGQLAESGRALETRRKLLEKVKATDDSGNEVRALMLVESQIADNAIALGQRAQAAAAMEKALKHADQLHDLAKGNVDTDQLYALWLAAEMYTFAGIPAKSDVPKRVDRAMTEMAKQGLPEFRNYMRWFEIYMSLMTPAAKEKRPASTTASATTPAP